MKYDEICHPWNAQAEDEKQWNSLTEAEKIEWAASIAAVKARGPWPVTVVLPEPVGALARDKDGVRISFHPGCTDKVRLRASLEEGLTGGPYRTEYVFSESQMRAFVLSERVLRQAAQEEAVALKERIARAGVEQRRALHEALQQEREACAQAALDTSQVVSDEELAKAFAGTDFGGADHRNELHVAVLKKASGYHCGHTITTIMRELRLIGASGLPTKKGRKLISLAYHALMVGGP